MIGTVDSWPFVCIVFAFVGWKGYGRHSMGKRYTRLNRLFQIITLVQGRRTLKREDLAALCEVHVRTISRDLATLNLSDFPCAFDEEAGGYKVARGLFMPPIDFKAEEALALLALLEEAGKIDNIPFMQTALKAAHKIRSQLPATVQDLIAPLDRKIQIDHARSMADDSPQLVYNLIQQAITNRRALRCRYESNKTTPTGTCPKRFFSTDTCRRGVTA